LCCSLGLALADIALGRVSLLRPLLQHARVRCRIVSLILGRAVATARRGIRTIGTAPCDTDWSLLKIAGRSLLKRCVFLAKKRKPRHGAEGWMGEAVVNKARTQDSFREGPNFPVR
jgi:hypothetical protein